LVPVVFERRPDEEIVAEGVAADSLGLFVGDPLGEDHGDGLPPQIILYLESLFEFAEGDEAIYQEEIQTTLLHEIGHYLGLDELDLEDRDLA
jgi:predicted Zn-dependent protease with MMP-like domain